jgi:hypothetical protein
VRLTHTRVELQSPQSLRQRVWPLPQPTSSPAPSAHAVGHIRRQGSGVTTTSNRACDKTHSWPSSANRCASPQAVASVLGVRERSDRSLLDVIVAHLARRQVMLVLDNCEHLVKACA